MAYAYDDFNNQMPFDNRVISRTAPPFVPCTQLIHEFPITKAGDYWLMVVVSAPLELSERFEVWQGELLIFDAFTQSISILLKDVQESEPIRLMANYPAALSRWMIREF